MIYVGLKAIARRMKWKAASTVLSNAEKYTEPELNFPLVMRPLPNGRFTWISEDALITEWLRRHQKLTPDKQLRRVQKLRPKTISRTRCEICGDIRVKEKWPKRYHTQLPLGREGE